MSFIISSQFKVYKLIQTFNVYLFSKTSLNFKFKYASFRPSHSCVLENFEITELNTSNLPKLVSGLDNEEKVSQILSEINCMNLKNTPLPKCLNTEQLGELYSLESRSQRAKYLRYLYKKERFRKSDVLKKEEKLKECNSKKSHTSEYKCDFSRYGLGNNTMLLGIRKKAIHKFLNQRVANSALFGSKIVIDLGYDSNMVSKERKSCVFQLQEIIGINRRDPDPFDLHFCNAISHYKCVRSFKVDLPKTDKTVLSFHEQSYLDLFPTEQLVYLSPHASEPLTNYDPDAIYIIGGFVDIIKKDKISFEKASKEGIKSYSLPLDDYIQWKQGSKSLTINQVFQIMTILKNTGSWEKAFEFLPSRKIQKSESHTEELEKENVSNR